MRDVNTSIGARIVTSISPVGHWTQPNRRAEMSGFSSSPQADDARPWHLPQQQQVCGDLVLTTAQRKGRTVTVIDANRPQGFETLVQQWVGPNDVFPILVRSDGARLAGVERFVPRTVDRFMGPKNPFPSEADLRQNKMGSRPGRQTP